MKRKLKGQALIIGVVIVFTAAITLATASAVISGASVKTIQNQKNAVLSNNFVYGCLENQLMNMTRGVFTAPENLSIEGGTCKIEISGSFPSYQILAIAQIDSALTELKVTKKIQAEVNISNGLVSIVSKREIY